MRRAAPTLSATRAAWYARTRPVFALAGGAAVYVVDEQLQQRAAAVESRPESSSSDGSAAVKAAAPHKAVEVLCLLPMAASGVAGVAAVLSRRGGFGWLGHAYERGAWAAAFGGVAVAAMLTGADAVKGGDAASGAVASGALCPSAAMALVATAGERLGAGAGRVLMPPLAGASCLAAAAALSGDPRGERAAQALQGAALLLLPALHACLPVFTHSTHGTLSLAWFALAAASSTLSGLEDTPLMMSSAAAGHLFVGVGTASMLRNLTWRRPICHY